MPPKPDSTVSLAVALALASLLVVACEPTGPPVDRDVEKMESFKHEDFGKTGKEWRESDTELPPYPQEGNLLRAYITGLTAFTFWIDAKSISIGDDGVVRYTLVARSSSGADNVSFEGMLCKKSEYKTYAIGSIDKTWVPVANPTWKPVKNPGINKYHYDLHRFYFCPHKIVPRDAGAVITAIKGGIPYPGPYY
ncbi:MAG: CNP1-like family protein [Burkholderiales bacterium]|jgi:hypothetical protein